MPVDAFGDVAVRIAGRIPGERHVVACEPSLAAAALTRALELRRAGTRFCASLFLSDQRDRAMRAASVAACARFQTWDEVRLTLSEAVDRPDAIACELSPGPRATLHELVRLADTLIVRSWTEHSRIAQALGSVLREPEFVVNQPELVVSDRHAAESIVIFAPDHRGNTLGAFITALLDVELPVVVVAREAPSIPSRVRYMNPAESTAALAGARVIVDAGRNDPGLTLALGRLGIPLAVAATSGAAELLRSVTSFVPWDRSSILAAATEALSAGPPVVRPPYWASEPAPPRVWALPPSPPLVSVVLPTHGRPEVLDVTLGSIDRQTYPAIETIVVNDAGADVREVVVRHNRTTLIDNPTNLGPAGARNVGLRAARGEYVLFFDDDDEMFPDHLTTLVGAIERSGLDVAYGQMINGFVHYTGRGSFEIDGVLAHYALLDHAEITWGGSLATTAILFRRSLIEHIGPLDESLTSSEDYEFWIRLAAGREWARVSEVTSLYVVRTDGSNRSSGVGARRATSYAQIYAKHPAERPLVAAGRAAMLQGFATAAAATTPSS